MSRTQEQYDDSLKLLDCMLKVQTSDGNWNNDPYRRGVADGMVFSKYVFTGKEYNNIIPIKEAAEEDTVKEKSNDHREQTLKEYISGLPSFHGIHKELKALKHCRENLFRWFMWDLLRKFFPLGIWTPPIVKDLRKNKNG
jgi:hypothetical protein